MPVSVTLTRSDGRELMFDDAPMGIIGLEGLDAPKTEIFTEKNAIGDGDVIVGKRIASRLITIKAANRAPALNEQMRKIIAAFLNPLYTFSVSVRYGGLERAAHECELKALALPTESLYKPLKVTFTLLCPTGYLDGSGGMYGADITEKQPRLGWPWVSLAGRGMIFSRYLFTRAVTVDNRGDAPTYIRAVFTALGPDTVTNPKLIKGGYYIRILTVLQPGDELEIDTEKRLVKLNGVSALQLVDKRSNWNGMRMNRGQSSFGFAADTNDNQLSVRIYYTERFFGMG